MKKFIAKIKCYFCCCIIKDNKHNINSSININEERKIEAAVV
jgi:hypothetical protein